MIERQNSALLVVDIQKDFCPGGALPVPHGDDVVRAMNWYLEQAVDRRMLVYASRDWHPAASTHFRVNGGQWPVHCVRDTDGARFHQDLQLPASAIVVTKGQDPSSGGYSAFEGETSDGRRLMEDLRARSLGHLYVGGLATDYCVKQSVLDALAGGLEVTLLEDAVAGVDASASADAIAAMRARGVYVTSGREPLMSPVAIQWEHFAHGADIGVRGIGPTRHAAFEQVARAMTSVVTRTKAVQPLVSVSIACEAPGDDLLLVDWLNALIYEMATRRMLFSAFCVRIENSHLRATAWGEPVDRIRHEPAVEVKGATYTELRVEHLEDGHCLAQCVVDV